MLVKIEGFFRVSLTGEAGDRGEGREARSTFSADRYDDEVDQITISIENGDLFLDMRVDPRALMSMLNGLMGCPTKKV